MTNRVLEWTDAADWEDGGRYIIEVTYAMKGRGKKARLESQFSQTDSRSYALSIAKTLYQSEDVITVTVWDKSSHRDSPIFERDKFNEPDD